MRGKLLDIPELLRGEDQGFCRKLQRQPSLLGYRMPDGNKVERREANNSWSDTCMDTFAKDVELEAPQVLKAAKVHRLPSAFHFSSLAFYSPLLAS